MTTTKAQLQVDLAEYVHLSPSSAVFPAHNAQCLLQMPKVGKKSAQQHVTVCKVSQIRALVACGYIKRSFSYINQESSVIESEVPGDADANHENSFVKQASANKGKGVEEPVVFKIQFE